MSKQPIKDYLIKQLFIEKNVVTYRSLSRQFGIHVSAAKKELEHYHAKAPEDGQSSYATYILSGEYKVLPVAVAKTRDNRSRKLTQQSVDADMSMDIDDGFLLTQSNEDEEDDDELDDYEADDDYEDVPVLSVTIVNEKDLEEAKAKYHRVHSVHVYSLSPSPIIDAGLLCPTTDSVRETDSAKASEYSTTVGKILPPKITTHKTKEQKEHDEKKGNARAPVPGPSRVRTVPEKKPGAPVMADAEIKSKKDPAASATASKPPPAESEKPAPSAKPKQTGKINFQPKQAAPVKSDKKTEMDEKKKGFFSAKPSKKAVAPSVKEEPKEDFDIPMEKQKRGIKRKSAIGADVSDTESGATTPFESVLSTSAASSRRPSPALGPAKAAPARATAPDNHRAQVKKGIILSSDEEDDDESSIKPQARAKAASKRRAEAAEKARLAEEKEAKELMDIDDDAVERISRKPAPVSPPSERKRDTEDEDNGHSEAEEQSKEADEDVEMEDVESQPKARKKRGKKVVPVGRNGLKKKRVSKTRVVTDAKGYTHTEDYSDWESVDEEAEEQKPKAKAKAKSKPKQEDKASADDGSGPSRAPSRTGSALPKADPAPKGAASKTASKPAPKASKPKPTGSANVKGKQQSIANFFGAKSKK